MTPRNPACREFLSGAQHGVLVRRAIEEVWNDGRLDIADELFAQTYRNHGGVIPDLARGPDAIKVSVAFYRAAFPELHITIDELRTDHETIVLRWTARNGDTWAQAAPPLDTSHRLRGITRSRLASGKIGETWTEWDRDEVLQRLGLVQPFKT